MTAENRVMLLYTRAWLLMNSDLHPVLESNQNLCALDYTGDHSKNNIITQRHSRHANKQKHNNRQKNTGPQSSNSQIIEVNMTHLTVGPKVSCGKNTKPTKQQLFHSFLSLITVFWLHNLLKYSNPSTHLLLQTNPIFRVGGWTHKSTLLHQVDSFSVTSTSRRSHNC